MKLYFKKFGSGSPLLILHGLFGMSDNWISIAKMLAENNQVFILDMRNHGRSPHTPDFNYSEMVEDIYEFLTDLNLRKVNIMGHSMGGKIAMRFAVEYPHRLEKLIVVDIGPKSYPIFHQNIISGLHNIKPEKLKSRQEADAALSQYVSSKITRQFLLKNLKRNNDGLLEWKINLPVISENLIEISSEVTAKSEYPHPVLFIRGGNSDYILNSDLDDVKKIFTASELITVPNTSHWIHSEDPDTLIKVVRKFISQ